MRPYFRELTDSGGTDANPDPDPPAAFLDVAAG
jgi:hypothetical protein